MARYNGNEKSHYIYDCCRMWWRPCEIIQNIKKGSEFLPTTRGFKPAPTIE
jgi:hypothetical protein